MADNMVTLSICDESRSTQNFLHLDLILTFWESDDGTSYELTCNLDPYDEQGVQTEYPVIVFEKTPEGVQKLLNRCKAEILAAVGPEQGATYLMDIEKQYGSTGHGGPVLN